MSYDVILTITKGATVTVLDNSNADWAKVKTSSGVQGWCSKEYLQFSDEGSSTPTPKPTSTPTPSKQYVRTTTAVNFRTGPGTNYSIIRTLATGPVLTVVDKSNSGWMQVMDSSGIKGYVSTEYLQSVSGSGISINLSHTSVTIPAGVTSIGNNAFSGCKSLANVTIPARVTNIDWCAFACCAGLTQVTIPERVTKIGNRVFSRCTGLTQITISEGIAEIGRRTFEGCTGLTQVTIPESVTNIGDSAFEGCTALREIILLGKPEIGKEAFPDSELTIVAEQFLMSDFSIPAYKQAAAKGFALRYTAGAELPEEYRADCLKYIKSQKKKLYPIALEFTPLLHVMLVEKMVPKGSFMELMDQASAHGNAEAFAMLLDYQNKQFEQGELKKLVERKMQQEMESLITGVLTATEAKKEWKYEKNLKGGICLLDYKGSETDVVVPTAIGKDHVTAIGSYAFSPTRSRLTAVRAEQRRQITTVRLSETVTQIGDYAFSSCIGLTDIAMPDSVTKIGESAFSNCQTLTSITIPKRVTNIGKNAFQDCPNLVIHAPVGSYAEQYAKKNSIPFQTMEE